MDTKEGWCVSVSRKSQKSKSQKSPDGPSAVAPPSAVTEDPVSKSEDEQQLDLVKEKIAEIDAQRIEHETQFARIQKTLAELHVLRANYSDEEALLKRKIARQKDLLKFENNPNVYPKSGCPPAPASSRLDPQEFPSLSEFGQSGNKGGSFLMAFNSSAPAPTPASPPAEAPTPKFLPETVDFETIITTLARKTGETVENPAFGEGREFCFYFPCDSLTPDSREFVETLAAQGFTKVQLIQHCKDAREVLQTVNTPIKRFVKIYSIIHLSAKDLTHSYQFRGTIKVTMQVYFTPPQKK
jgi:hypothetical protein